MKIPGLHELATCFQCVGDTLVGRPHVASKRWRDCSEESVIGSGVMWIVHKVQANPEGQRRSSRGFTLAMASAATGGGVLPNVPVFHELSTCGKSLGKWLVDGDDAAKEVWRDYADNSFFGSGVMAASVAWEDPEEAQRLGRNCAGGALNGTVSQVAQPAYVDGAERRLDSGAIVGGTLFGGVAGGAAGAVSAASTARASAGSGGPQAPTQAATTGGARAAPTGPSLQTMNLVSRTTGVGRLGVETAVMETTTTIVPPPSIALAEAGVSVGARMGTGAVAVAGQTAPSAGTAGETVEEENADAAIGNQQAPFRFRLCT
uniref:Uncharacterized protein n=1 Tax=Chromera velia CCMP2878 TaxID=1169474 RepID=A0A0G4I707_9ALVE|eukprot:Cvel_11477.t1-p1 / transcript=Cvel_11477.t1 / gene=Cvel_11477 / organism=Chromera_velia_CCMP2878 / gene_product=hypothetical protein / transcript_product=hypothetical protein / location=Cvel_scaffold722:61088-62160(+) / protein_length=317 / sequence_SO=supercontig / SO=protein_coding / is_pseudo=false